MTRHAFRLADGRVLAWQEQGEGPSLVLLHGWSLSGAAFSELAGLLNDFRVLIPDLPGHGHSSPPTTATLPALADDLTVWLAAVATFPVFLGGWSLGGMIAMELAARREIPIDRLLLLATTPRFTTAADWPHGLPAGQVRALRRDLVQRFETTLADFLALAFAIGEIDAARLRAIHAFAVRPGGLPDRVTAAALLDLLAGQDQRELPPRIGCPALVVHGTLDRVAPVAAGRVLAASLPRGRLQELADTGHAPCWTRPAAVAHAVRELWAWVW
jgi:pimeloyl-[acyl-carrier protein] methyl ester esterase